MSFGKLNTLIEKINIFLKDELLKYEVINFKILNKLKNEVLNIYSKDMTNLKLNNKLHSSLINEIFSRLFIPYYKYNDKIIYDNGINCFRDFEFLYDDIKTPNTYSKLEKHFNKLKKLPQPEQRTQEWFNYRYNRITASDTAAAIDMNPYEPIEKFILKKCDPEHLFRDNNAVFHGKKYEPIATLLYEHIYNNRVIEFGALPSENYPFLGASPDGICSKYTLDNNFSSRLGRMLEIKCPITRDIIINGNIIGDICPYYYYCQIQQQLECCNLDICDFWQCRFIEYKSRQDYLNDDCYNYVYTESNEDLQINNLTINDKIKKGILLEFYPKNFKSDFEGDNIEWKSKYIIPPRLDIDELQYNDFIIKSLDEYKKLYPDIYNNYYFNKIIYWKLEKCHNVAIKRNNIFLSNIIPILKNTWNDIVYYRKNKDKLQKLRDVVKNKTKYIKLNSNINIHNKYMSDNKILFLDSNFNLNTFFNNYNKKLNDIPVNETNECDFID